MKVKISCLQHYRDIFSGEGIELILLGKSADDIERLAKGIVNIDSNFLFPTDNKEKLHRYAKKLIEHGYNFILTDGNSDIGVLSIYANDFVTKTAYTSTIGIIPSYRGGNLIANLVNFGLEFAKEIGMEKFKAEIHKVNSRWLKFLFRFKFQIECETVNKTYIIVRDL
ncbi:GNAT family N-acetyltransferase [Robertmurraya andreesenii]|uniref:N-acetyltransferase domain-containing protein n=1 Tax=Anoxybacillus andreesenii TaxID=1325932 RepID=A0ABT9V382_9BACL|nr:GNAT family N-acetyltransferase [Robertmurraya andreesenii]MDQ0155372.1 hypothetical protein [Robertmurraya andreesenii]